MGEKINLRFVGPEHSNQISCLLGADGGEREMKILCWTCQCDCFEGRFCFLFEPLSLCANAVAPPPRVIERSVRAARDWPLPLRMSEALCQSFHLQVRPRYTVSVKACHSKHTLCQSIFTHLEIEAL